MRERLSNYILYMEKTTAENHSTEEKEELLKDLLIQIGFFQHERIIHLMVTLGFSIITIVSLFCATVEITIPLMIFILGMLIFMFFYVRHYFFLERGVQKLYTYYDKLTAASHK